MNTFNTQASTAWVPFKIPPTVVKDSPDDVYALSFSNDANPNKNPTQFLTWVKVQDVTGGGTSLPNGTNAGDILYWDPNSGTNGEWVVLLAPQDNVLHGLTITNGSLSWIESESFDVCENGQPVSYKFIAQKVE